MSGGKCKRKTRKNAGKKKCDLLLKGSFTHAGQAGKNSFKFTGRLGDDQLATGKYWMEVAYFDAAGNAGKAVRAAFQIVKRS